MKFQSLLMAFILALTSTACKKKGGSTGGSSPTPTPGASASPSPTERYPGLPSSCQPLTNGTPGSTCTPSNANRDRDFRFYQKMEDSVAQVQNEHRDYFEADGESIKQWDNYVKAVMAAANSRGLCAVYDGFQMFVRDSQNLHEYYQIAWQNRARAFTRETCTPVGPMPAFYTSPPPHDPWCPLPNSSHPEDEGCEKEGSLWNGNVLQWQTELVNSERPKGTASEIFDFANMRQGDDLGYRIKDTNKYFNKLIEKAHGANLCAYAPGYFDTLALKSPTGGNAFSEAFDVVLHKGPSDPGPLMPGAYVRSASNGSNYLATCRPPEF